MAIKTNVGGNMSYLLLNPFFEDTHSADFIYNYNYYYDDDFYDDRFDDQDNFDKHNDGFNDSDDYYQEDCQDEYFDFEAMESAYCDNLLALIPRLRTREKYRNPLWDDEYMRGARSWKNYRATQYKNVNKDDKN